MEPRWEETPEWLRYYHMLYPSQSLTFFRHLHQWRLTADGNHQCNKYQKNNDPDDISLFNGKAYFPTQQNYLAHLKNFPQKFQVEVRRSYLRHICIDSLLENSLRLFKGGKSARSQKIQKYGCHRHGKYPMRPRIRSVLSGYAAGRKVGALQFILCPR